jgi:hypothetical protein
MQKILQKKQSIALEEKIAFKKIKHRLKRKSAKGILQKKHAKLSAKRNLCKQKKRILNPFKKIKASL